jgi:hypothetical protein
MLFLNTYSDDNDDDVLKLVCNLAAAYVLFMLSQKKSVWLQFTVCNSCMARIHPFRRVFRQACDGLAITCETRSSPCFGARQ